MKQELKECYEVPQGFDARIVKINGIVNVEIWDLAGGEFPAVEHELTADEVYCIDAPIAGLGNVLRTEDFTIPATNNNLALSICYDMTEIIKSKTEVSKEEFINICKKIKL